MGEKYQTWIDGEWAEVYHRNQKFACCDCSLVHVLNFKIVKKGKRQAIKMQVKRDPRATSAMRRPYKFEKE